MLAFVLGRRDFRENDQVISLFSQEKGKISALARGVKKIVSKNSAYLEPFFLVEAEIIPGRDIKHITKVVGLNSFKYIRANLLKSLAAQRAVSLVSELTEEGQRDLPVFHLLKEWLEFADGNSITRSHFFGLAAKLFLALGFKPVLDKCVYCSKEMPKATAIVSFSLAGGVVCGACRQKNNYETAVKVKFSDIQSWKKYLNSPAIEWPAEISRSLETAIWSFAEFHGNKKLAKLSEI